MNVHVVHVSLPLSGHTASVLGTCWQAAASQPACLLLQCWAALHLVLTRKLQMAHRKGRMTKVKRMKACTQQQAARLMLLALTGELHMAHRIDTMTKVKQIKGRHAATGRPGC